MGNDPALTISFRWFISGPNPALVSRDRGCRDTHGRDTRGDVAYDGSSGSDNRSSPNSHSLMTTDPVPRFTSLSTVTFPEIVTEGFAVT